MNEFVNTYSDSRRKGSTMPKWHFDLQIILCRRIYECKMLIVNAKFYVELLFNNVGNF